MKNKKKWKEKEKEFYFLLYDQIVNIGRVYGLVVHKIKVKEK